MTWFVVDVESDGPSPMRYSMVCFGAVPVGRHEEQSFYGQTAPIHGTWVQEALAVSGFTREQHVAFDDPQAVMKRFVEWIDTTTVGSPVFVSDNNGYDWQFINGYLHYFVGRNPFGHSSRRIGDLYAGLKGRASAASEWKRLRKTAHTHHPVDDARGNAEALAAMRDLGLKVTF
jgi:hypothetical protein